MTEGAAAAPPKGATKAPAIQGEAKKPTAPIVGGRSTRAAEGRDQTLSEAIADLVARDANEGDTRLFVTDFLCDGLATTSTKT